MKVVAYIYNLLSFRQFMLHAPVLERILFLTMFILHQGMDFPYDNRKSLVAILRRSTLDWMKYREM